LRHGGTARRYSPTNSTRSRFRPSTSPNRSPGTSSTCIVNDQTNTIADLAIKQAEKGEQVARKQADTVEQAKREQEAQIEDARKEQAREPYADLTKAELADQLAERGLPKTGNVEQLIERLISADSEEHSPVT
jgi:hypothetical protein